MSVKRNINRFFHILIVPCGEITAVRTIQGIPYIPPAPLLQATGFRLVNTYLTANRPARSATN